MDHLEYCAALEKEIERFANALDLVASDVMVPACPGWFVTDLAHHLGTVHRWAEHLVRFRASEWKASQSMGLNDGPATSGWIREGGVQLLATLRESDPTASMWAWGPDQRVGWWSRRQLHETLVHRMDVELASGRSVDAEVGIVTDAIDEFLVNLNCAARFSPKVRELKGNGDVFTVNATNADFRRSIRLVPDGFELVDGAATYDAELSGSAIDLLLVLYRRVPLTSSELVTSGNHDLVNFWIEHSALE